MKFDIDALMTAFRNNVETGSRDLGAVAAKNDEEYDSARKEYMTLLKQFMEQIKDKPELMELIDNVIEARNLMEACSNKDHYLLGGREMLHLVLDEMLDDSMKK